MIKIQVIFPGLFTCLWMAIFSGSTLYFDGEMSSNLFNLLAQKGPQAILFEIFSFLPGSTLMHIILLVVIFFSFVTAADSNIDAISSLCLRESQSTESKSSWFIKIFWGLTLGFISWIMVCYTGVEGMRVINFLGGIPALGLILFFIFGLIKVCWDSYFKKRKSFS